MLKPLNDVIVGKPLVDKEALSDYKLSQDVKSQLVDVLGKEDYGFNAYTSYAITEKAREDKAANYAVIPNQYFVFACEMYDFATELYKYFNIFDRIRAHSSKLVGDASHISHQIYMDPNLKKEFENDDDIELFAKFLDKDNSDARLGSKRLINDQGVPRGAKDCFTSVILKEINIPDVSSSIFGRLVYDLCAKPVIYDALMQSYKGLADSRNHRIEKTLLSKSNIRGFVFDVFNYLFERNLESTLFNALVTAVIGEKDKVYCGLEQESKTVYRLLLMSDSPLGEEDLTSGHSLRFFKQPYKFNNQYYYLSNQWVDKDGTEDNVRDISIFSEIFNELYDNLKITKENDTYKLIESTWTVSSSSNIATENLSKPFLLLAGISGTGKTRFVREQAKASGSLSSTYCLTSVRPDWHEPSDLLGYISRLNGPAQYITTDVLQFVAKAWRAMLEGGLELKAITDEKQGERLVVSGERTMLDAVLPYWLCLDEMNLAPVEQYFADYLSVLETREWNWNGDDFIYACDPLLKASTIEQIDNKQELRQQLGFADEKYDDDWQLFCKHGLGIPLNLIVAGTVNMDETTHGFSRKVIDRALTFDFGEFFPNDFNQFFEPDTQNKTLTYPLLTQARIEDLVGTADEDGKKSIAFLTKVNAILDGTPFKLAFRALNELLIAVISQNPQDELTLKAVWDDFLMSKVLPRIEGDSDKLDDSPSLLEKLTLLLKDELKEFWGGDDSEPLRPDLYREYITESEKVILITCRSREKLAWMQSRLDTAGFTSFWP